MFEILLQDALSKSNDVFEAFKQEMEKVRMASGWSCNLQVDMKHPLLPFLFWIKYSI